MSTSSISLDNNTLSAIKTMMREHRSEMDSTITNLINRIAGSGMGVMGGFRRGGAEKDAKAELEMFLSIMKKNRATLSATEKFQREVAAKEVRAINEEMRRRKQNTDGIEENTESTEKATDANKKNTGAIKDATDKLGQMARGVVAGTLSFNAVTKAVDEFQQAYKHGLNWNALGDSIHAAFTMGLSPKEMMEFQTKFRRVSNTLDDGISQFTGMVSANQNDWKKYTGSLRDAAFAQGEFADITLSMGLGTKEMDGAVGGLFEEFKRLQSITSDTSDQFVAMARSLLGEESVRTKLVGMQRKERENYAMGLTQTNIAFRALGLQEEVAAQAIKMIESQTVSPAKQRLKQSYQLQTEARVYNMDPDKAGRMGELIRMQNHSESERQEMVKLAQEFAEARQSYRTSGATLSERLANEMRSQHMAGINPASDATATLGANFSLAEGATINEATIAKQREDIAARNEGLQGEIIEQITKFSNIFTAWGATALAALLGGSFAAVKFGKGFLGEGAPGGGAGGGTGASGSMKKLWDTLGKGGRMAGLGLLAGGVVSLGQTVADPQTEEKKNIWDKAAMGAAGGAAIGSIIPGFGTLIGGAIGGAIGLGIGGLLGHAENEGFFDNLLAKEKKAMASRYTDATAVFEFEKFSYQNQLNRLNELEQTKGISTAKEKAALQDRFKEAERVYNMEISRHAKQVEHIRAITKLQGMDEGTKGKLVAEQRAMIQRSSDAEMMYQFEQTRYKEQLAQAEALARGEGELAEKQKARVIELKELLGESQKRYDNANATQNADRFIFSAKNAAAITKTMEQAASSISKSWGYDYGTTSEVDARLSEIQSRLQLSGVEMSANEIRDLYTKHLGNVLVDENIAPTRDISETVAALKSGSNHDYDNAVMNPILGKAMEAMLPDVNRLIQSNLQASFTESFSKGENLAGLQMRIDELKATQEADLAAANMSNGRGMMSIDPEAQAARERLEESRMLAGYLQQLVNKDTVKMDDDAIGLFEKMADSLETLAKGGQRKMGSGRR